MIIKIILFTFAFFVLTKFNIDPDLGWHLAYGNEFLQEGKIIQKDPFSWTMPNFEWGNSYLGYQILLAYIFNNFGYTTSAIVFGLISTFALLFLLPKKLSLYCVVLCLFGIMIASANLGIRPHAVSFLLFSILIYFLNKQYYVKFNHIIIWFLLFALWSNFHRGFLVGLLVLISFLIIDIWVKARKNIKVPVLVIFFSFVSTFFNPLKFSIYSWPVLLDLSSFENLSSILELQPVGVSSPAVIFLFIASGVVFIWMFIKQKAIVIDERWLLLAAALFMLAYVMSGFLLFWAAIFIFLVSRWFQTSLVVRHSARSEESRSFFVLIFIVIAINFVVASSEPRDLNQRFLIDGYPVRALEFIREKKLNTRVFNEYSWGGFIDWQYSEIKVFIDGRMASWRDHHGKSILKDYLSIMEGECQKVDEYRVQTALIKKDFNLSCFADWHKVYEDPEAVVLQRP